VSAIEPQFLGQTVSTPETTTTTLSQLLQPRIKGK